MVLEGIKAAITNSTFWKAWEGDKSRFGSNSFSSFIGTIHNKLWNSNIYKECAELGGRILAGKDPLGDRVTLASPDSAEYHQAVQAIYGKREPWEMFTPSQKLIDSEVPSQIRKAELEVAKEMERDRAILARAAVKTSDS